MNQLHESFELLLRLTDNRYKAFAMAESTSGTNDDMVVAKVLKAQCCYHHNILMNQLYNNGIYSLEEALSKLYIRKEYESN